MLSYAGEEHHVVAIDGVSPLMPLAWLILLAGGPTFHQPKRESCKLNENAARRFYSIHGQDSLLGQGNFSKG